MSPQASYRATLLEGSHCESFAPNRTLRDQRLKYSGRPAGRKSAATCNSPLRATRGGAGRTRTNHRSVMECGRVAARRKRPRPDQYRLGKKLATTKICRRHCRTKVIRSREKQYSAPLASNRSGMRRRTATRWAAVPPRRATDLRSTQGGNSPVARECVVTRV